MNELDSRPVSAGSRKLRVGLAAGVSVLATSLLAAPAFAQDAAPSTAPSAEQGAAGGAAAQGTTAGQGDEEILVTGIRASLDRAIDIRRNSDGIVDAISAEDIGKFPDTNLAESLQRIPGVSISRVNGEGSEVTVRGFGGAFNLVTLNGRTMPASNVNAVGGDQDVDFARATSRSFDFSNLAAEGVRTLEVYKTGRPSIPSGGIGATINVVTMRPLDAGLTGLSGSIGARAVHDASVDRGSDITPEVSGVLSWVDPNERVGISIFGSYQERDSAAVSATSNAWNIRRLEDFLNPDNGFVNAATQIENAPAPGSLVSVPNDSRYHFSESERERLNAQAVLQFRPIDTLTFTADALYARQRQNEQRTDQTNWFNRPFRQVRFDDNPDVATTIFLQENISGVKDTGFEQQYRATEDTLESYGLNLRWEATDALTFTLDGHISEADSGPGARNGASSTLVSIGAPVIAAHSVDYTGRIPVQNITINDALRGNGNGVLDIGDLGSQVARTNASRQNHRINEVRFDARWELSDQFRVDVGGDYVDSRMRSDRTQTQQTLGDWGIGDPGDVEQFAPGLVEQFCLTCRFDRFDPQASGASLIAFRGNALDLYDALSQAYAGLGNPVNVTGNDFNVVEEEVWAVYGQLTWQGDLFGRPATLVIGGRYEETRVDSLAIVAVPDEIRWVSDNDFTRIIGSRTETIVRDGRYNNFLPAIDFRIEAFEDFIIRASASRTLARPEYGNLFVSDTANAPGRPIANGGVASGASGNADLDPLVSDNFDIAAEWYFAPSSYVSAGFFYKHVRNFVGTSQVTRQLFGLRDPSSGAPGTRSGIAREQLLDIGADISDVNLFTLTALIVQNGGDVAAARAQFEANYSGGALNQAFVDATLRAVDISPDANDPFFEFAVNTPVNNRSGDIHGIELAGQYFLGNTGLGIAGSYTMVNGDVSIDVGADPGVDQFALLGLSDSFNVTLIYENYGISARLAYNWRDKYLAATNRGGGDRNPVFVAPFGTLDLNLSYDINPQFAVSFEAINLTSEPVRTYGRDPSNLWFAQELKPRFILGGRFRF
ncbi:TonB-dependent receptor [Sphingosinicella terrae]|uniref:TonB-dependent receptor n=1 Tax=Sphingosinicella terrae TaxID=2172047 RepID=UPI000E0D973A|nr:TonB-dependent receptor [Sphingosinicella terrae]